MLLNLWVPYLAADRLGRGERALLIHPSAANGATSAANIAARRRSTALSLSLSSRVTCLVEVPVAHLSSACTRLTAIRTFSSYRAWYILRQSYRCDISIACDPYARQEGARESLRENKRRVGSRFNLRENSRCKFAADKSKPKTDATRDCSRPMLRASLLPACRRRHRRGFSDGGRI